MKGDRVRALASAPVSASTRSLSTARSVLRVLSLLVESPGGVRADEVAVALGKSISTAYYLLTSLCEEGFAVHESKGVYRPARGLEELTAVAEEAGVGSVSEGLTATVDELFIRTCKRSYLGIVRAGRIEITTFRGRQGVPRIPGLDSEIRDSAHALAMGKVVLALLDPPGLAHYVARGLRAFTPHTITSPAELVAELERVRADGFAVDREEFGENFCCIAAPIYDDRGRFVATLGLSVSAMCSTPRASACPRWSPTSRTARSPSPRPSPRAVAVRHWRRSHEPGGRQLQADAENPSFLSHDAGEPSLDVEAVSREQQHARDAEYEGNNEGVKVSRSSITKAHNKIQELSWESTYVSPVEKYGTDYTFEKAPKKDPLYPFRGSPPG